MPADDMNRIIQSPASHCADEIRIHHHQEETEPVSGKRFISILLLLCAVGISLSACGAQEQARFRIVGYLPDYRFKGTDLDQAALLTDLVLFAAEPAENGEVQLGKLKNAPWEKLWDLRDRHQTRLILCIGGWERSNHFSQVVRNPRLRVTFAKSLLQTLQNRKLNGLDIDWEYPRTPEDWNGFIALLEQLKSDFQPHRYSLSLTVAPWREVPEAAWKAVDRVQLMSYDYGQQHSTPQQALKDIQTFLDRGVPAEKIVLGLPFYGRHVTDRKAITYARLVDRYQPDDDSDEVDGIYFNGPATIRQKTQQAIESGIGGVMIWEIGQDRPGENSLLNNIAITARRGRRMQIHRTFRRR